MLWEGRALREIREADVRALVESGLAEHEQLEYKSELYENNDRGKREFLLDIGMFANTSGGILLIGIPEQRDAGGQPTGTPDPAGIIGLEIPILTQISCLQPLLATRHSRPATALP